MVGTGLGGTDALSTTVNRMTVPSVLGSGCGPTGWEQLRGVPHDDLRPDRDVREVDQEVDALGDADLERGDRLDRVLVAAVGADDP